MPFSRPPFTGFPFDSDDSHFRSELEDIALRHPEFAEHLNPAQRRANTNRFRSQDPFADYRSSSRDWPFGSRIHQFGFPFTSEFDDDPLNQQQYQAQADERPPQQKQEEKVQEKPPQPPQSQQTEERSRRPHQHIQQSNTVDLGQKQEAVDDNRNQRSMSAPPENRNTSNKRFVSSINIPNFNQGAGDNMGGRMSQPETPPQQQQQQQQQSSKPTERIIPIHIEGRDEPIIPKNVNISSSGAAPKQQPQPERIFGQRPSTFTQFLNRDPQNIEVEKQREELARQQQQEYQRQQQEYQKQQQQEYQKEQEAAHKQTPPPEQKPTPLELIQNIQKDVSKLMEDVGKFEGKPRDKQYLYLDEMLTRNLLKLDNIETEGKDTIRQARKEAIKCIEQCIGILESKANANEIKLKALEEAKSETSQPQEETETKAPAVEPPPAEETPVNTEPMEVESPKPTQEAQPKEEEVKAEEKEKTEDKQPPPVEASGEKTTTEEKKPEPEPSEPSQGQPKEEKQEKKKGKKK